MKVKTMVLGQMQTNCYIVSNEKTKEAIVIDPADCASEIIQYLVQEQLTLKAILLTHGHFDHIMAANMLRKEKGVSIYAGEKEEEVLMSSVKNLSQVWSEPFTLNMDVPLKDGEVLSLCGYDFKVIETPGHTVGSVCYYVEAEDVLFSGDTLFYESMGRTDFPTSSLRQLVQSVVHKLFVLPKETFLYPGHGESTDIAWEIEHNPVSAYGEKKEVNE